MGGGFLLRLLRFLRRLDRNRFHRRRDGGGLLEDDLQAFVDPGDLVIGGSGFQVEDDPGDARLEFSDPHPLDAQGADFDERRGCNDVDGRKVDDEPFGFLQPENVVPEIAPDQDFDGNRIGAFFDRNRLKLGLLGGPARTAPAPASRVIMIAARKHRFIFIVPSVARPRTVPDKPKSVPVFPIILETNAACNISLVAGWNRAREIEMTRAGSRTF